jgi:FecR protein
MKKLVTTFLAVGLIGAGFAGQSVAQTVKQDKRENREAAAASSLYVISAKAGAVNFVSGKVAIDRRNAKSGYLVKGDTVEKGERVRTGGDGKAEILLNPGSYVRLSENANFRFNSTSLDDLQIALTSGSAIFEIITDDDFNVAVNTPKSSYQLIKSGVYRVDALSDGTGKISVWKGKAKYGTGKDNVVKGGQTTAIVNGQISVQKFDRDNKGEFEVWSKDRAKEIARVNAKLQQKAMSRSLISSYAQGGFNSWRSSGRFGLWVFDPLSSGFCFLPFGNGWSSPYGFGFNRSIWNYNLPPQIYNNINPGWNLPGYQPPANNGNTGNNGNWGNPGIPGNPSSPSMPPSISQPSMPAPVRDIPTRGTIPQGETRSPQVQMPTRIE